MKHDEFAAWLEGYRKAWENLNPDAAVQLFSEDATYQETPYDIPMQGVAEIWEYWAEVSKSQTEVRFRWTILSVSGNCGIARWQVGFKRISSGVQVELDGILTAVITSARTTLTSF